MSREPELDRTFICDDCGREQLSSCAVMEETDDGDWHIHCADCNATPSRSQLRNAHESDAADYFEQGYY